MVRTLRAALTLVVVCLGLVVVVDAPAFACSCKPISWKQQVEQADVIFVATVDSVRDTGPRDTYGLTATRTYQGDVERYTEVSSPSNSCGLGQLDIDKDYLFLARGEEMPYSANVCGGTSAANPNRIGKIEEVLGEGRSIDPPPPPKAELTRVEDSSPLGFARLAAPGGAAVLLALLGLFVVRRVSRR